MVRHFFTLLATLALTMLLVPAALAQRGGNSGGFGNTGGGFGNTGGNSGGFGNSGGGFGNTGGGFGNTGGGFGNTGGNSGGFGNTGGQQSGGMFGSRTLGSGVQGNNSSFGAGSTTSGGMFGSSSGGGSNDQQQQFGATGTERYTRDGRQPGQFVGADRSDTAGLLSQQGGQLGGMQGMQGMQGLQGMMNGMNGQNGMNGRNPNQMNQNGMGQNQRVKVRTTLKFAGAPIAPLASPATVAKVQTRFTKLPQFRGSGSVKFEVEGRTAVLRGTVSSEHDRALAERVALLEPGISAVQNELTVDPAAATAKK